MGPADLGARRSPLRTPEHARCAVEHIAQLSTQGPPFRLVGVMGYEAQIAGMTDSSPAVRLMKKVSAREVARRRAAVVADVRGYADFQRRAVTPVWWNRPWTSWNVVGGCPSVPRATGNSSR
ncbi:hypothetical protein [Kocuria sp. ZOR0020]|uniref:hypothetical protein n=1 Tax=Kocuria sp. ZOR0020 TaxID=1339234 RepID=UPI000AA19616|nr:hypothetical protein [Kocuria sp. ZOR0020]